MDIVGCGMDYSDFITSRDGHICLLEKGLLDGLKAGWLGREVHKEMDRKDKGRRSPGWELA